MGEGLSEGVGSAPRIAELLSDLLGLCQDAFRRRYRFEQGEEA